MDWTAPLHVLPMLWPVLGRLSGCLADSAEFVSQGNVCQPGRLLMQCKQHTEADTGVEKENCDNSTEGFMSAVYLCCDVFGACFQERLQVLLHLFQSRLQNKQVHVNLSVSKDVYSEHDDVCECSAQAEPHLDACQLLHNLLWQIHSSSSQRCRVVCNAATHVHSGYQTTQTFLQEFLGHAPGVQAATERAVPR